MSHEQQTQTAGADMSPRHVPEQIRITLLATVTGRMIELRRQPESMTSEYELSRLVPAAQWLTGKAASAGGAGEY